MSRGLGSTLMVHPSANPTGGSVGGGGGGEADLASEGLLGPSTGTLKTARRRDKAREAEQDALQRLAEQRAVKRQRQLAADGLGSLPLLPEPPLPQQLGMPQQHRIPLPPAPPAPPPPPRMCLDPAPLRQPATTMRGTIGAVSSTIGAVGGARDAVSSTWGALSSTRDAVSSTMPQSGDAVSELQRLYDEEEEEDDDEMNEDDEIGTRSGRAQAEMMDEDEGAALCTTCGGSAAASGRGALVCCAPAADGCGRFYHLGCLTPPLKKRPPRLHQWHCASCRALEAERLRSQARTQRGNVAAGGRPLAAALSTYELEQQETMRRNQRELEARGLK